MAEALAALGVVSSILQVVDFAAKLTAHAHHLIVAGNDALRENIETERLARGYETLTRSILEARVHVTSPVNGQHPSPLDQQIVSLAEQCGTEAKKLLQELHELRLAASLHGWKRFKAGTQKAVRHLATKKKIQVHCSLLDQKGSLLSAMLQEADRRSGKGLRERILQTLKYRDMFSREMDIDEACPGTCRWLLQDESLGFQPWLRAGNGTFWITGKPASGKSTLMKKIFSDYQTQVLLKKWAGTRELVTASLHFWYLGNDLQKSIRGLLICILYRLAEKAPIKSLAGFPVWCFEEQRTDHILPDPRWRQEILASTIKDLVAALKNAGYAFCFFVDGLDECTGNYIELIHFLDQLSRAGKVKLYIASREWPVFTSTYGSSGQLVRMQELTHNDIQTFVRDALSSTFSFNMLATQSHGTDNRHSATHATNCQLLVDEIVSKAEGVFVWVRLMVNSIKRGYAEGDDVEMLRERVQDTPADLHDFFHKLIYARIDTAYRYKTCQALRLAYNYFRFTQGESKCLGPNTIMSAAGSFLDFWFILRRPAGLLNVTCPYENEPRSKPLQQLWAEMKSGLVSACKDLLVMKETGRASFDSHPTRPGEICYVKETVVMFFHKTVFDFLQRQDIGESLARHTPALFEMESVFSLFSTARLKSVKKGEVTNHILAEWIDSDLCAA